MKKHLRTLLKDGRTAVSASAASFPEKLVADERAAITIVAALALPAVIGLVALAVEFGNGLLIRDETQRVADEAAYAGALAYVATRSQTSMQSAAQNVAVLNGVAKTAVTANLVTSPRTSTSQAVQVTITTDEPIVFGQVVGFGGSVQIAPTSYAEIPSAGSGGSLCILALNSSGAGVTLSGGTSINAPKCVVASQASVTVPCGDTITAEDVDYAGSKPTVSCAGGIVGTVQKVSNSDPLADNAGIVAANTRAVANEALASPTIASPPSGTNITFDWSNQAVAEARSAGCAATWSSPTWTLTCPSGGTYSFGSVSLGGGITVNFNTCGSASTTYNFSGAVTNSGTSLSFGPGTFNMAGGLVTGGGSTTAFGAGAFNIGKGPSCSGANYSICHTGTTLTFGGPSAFVLTSGIYNSGGETITLGGGSTNSYQIGPSSNGYALNVGGGEKTTFADATGSNSVFQAVGDLYESGGACTTLPAATNHDINGTVSLAGGLTLGSGLYAIAGNFWLGVNGGGDVWCQGVNANVGVYGLNVTIAVTGSSPKAVTPPSGSPTPALYVSAGFSGVTISAPTSGTYQNVAIVGPLSTSTTAGITLNEGGSATIGGALYFPNGPMTLSGGSSASNGANQCLEIVATAVTLSGGTSINDLAQCALPTTGSAGGNGAPVLVE